MFYTLLSIFRWTNFLKTRKGVEVQTTFGYGKIMKIAMFPEYFLCTPSRLGIKSTWSCTCVWALPPHPRPVHTPEGAQRPGLVNMDGLNATCHSPIPQHATHCWKIDNPVNANTPRTEQAVFQLPDKTLFLKSNLLNSLLLKKFHTCSLGNI